MDNWQLNARRSLKTAKDCNKFFQTNKFKEQQFPIKIPIEFANLIDKNNPQDPLLNQIISQTAVADSFTLEPLADDKFSPVAGLIHKYPHRALLITSQVCAIHCRYCFRQNFNYAQHDALSNWQQVHTYLQEHKNINEVILSGGDPLSLSDDKLQRLLDNISKIKHIRTLRIHSRSAVVTPNRLTSKLISMLNNYVLPVVLVLHANHPTELSSEFAKKIRLLNITKLNQSVLLQGVNACKHVLIDLSLRLFSLGILPYYLHMLDRVKGSERYLVSDIKALELRQEMQQELSGYLVPKLVRDSPDSNAKQNLT